MKSTAAHLRTMQNLIHCVAGDKTWNVRNSCRAAINYLFSFCRAMSAMHQKGFASLDTVGRSAVESNVSTGSGVMHCLVYSA